MILKKFTWRPQFSSAVHFCCSCGLCALRFAAAGTYFIYVLCIFIIPFLSPSYGPHTGFQERCHLLFARRLSVLGGGARLLRAVTLLSWGRISPSSEPRPVSLPLSLGALLGPAPGPPVRCWGQGRVGARGVCELGDRTRGHFLSLSTDECHFPAFLQEEVL